MRSGSRALACLSPALGLGGIALVGYVLAGRPPSVEMIRGVGPLSLLLVAIGTALVAVAIEHGRRRASVTSKAANRLTALLVGTMIAGGAIILRHPLSGHPEFPHRDGEVTGTWVFLIGAGFLLVELWALPTLAAGIRYSGDRRLDGWGLLARLPEATAQFGAGRARVALPNVALVIVSVTVTALFCEGAYRVAMGIPLSTLENLVSAKTALIKNNPGNEYDPLLGWVIAENQVLGDRYFVSGARGIRMNQDFVKPIPTGAILVVGDSFALGAEVRNRDTWPAILEEMLHRPVVNAATAGWGTDQIVLRAESLIEPLAPTDIVVSFLVDDIGRAAYSTYGGGNKPFFQTRDGVLEMHNVPVPLYSGSSHEMGWLRGILGYSELVNRAMQAGGFSNWWFGNTYRQVDNDAAAVSCLLLARLKKRTDAAGIRLFFVLQYGGNNVVLYADEMRAGKRVWDCASHLGIRSVNTWSVMRAAYRRDPEAFKELSVMHEHGAFYGHLSGKGNRLTAELIAPLLAADPARDRSAR